MTTLLDKNYPTFSKYSLTFYISSKNRTKVECAGLCLSMEDCNSFYWDETSTSCQVLTKDKLCLDHQNISPVVVYAKIDDMPDLCPGKFSNISISY